MKNGVYLNKLNCSLWILNKVENYEDLKTSFSIVYGEYEYGDIYKCLITKKQYNKFLYLGEL